MTSERAAAVGAESVSLDILMQTSDIVSLHIVASPTTKGMINQEKLALMKKDALLINTSRSTLVDTGALVQALQKQSIGGAALDVFDIEPLPADHPLRSTPNTLTYPTPWFRGRARVQVIHNGCGGIFGSLVKWSSHHPSSALIAATHVVPCNQSVLTVDRKRHHHCLKSWQAFLRSI